MNSSFNFPLKECKNHSFCHSTTLEDNSVDNSKDLRSFIRSVSPNKKPDVRSKIIPSTVHPGEYDIRYLKKIEPEMDDFSSVKPSIPILTHEELIDWCQQTMNRKFNGIPLTKPFMMSKVMHEKLRELQKFIAPSTNAAPIEKEFMTVTEVETILNRKSVPVRRLQPRSFENGVPFMYPREIEKKKDVEGLSVSEVKRSRHKSARAGTIFVSEKVKIEKKVNSIEEVSLFKLDSLFAKQVIELSKRKIKFFQNLAFSSAFLGKVIETNKSLNFNVPTEFKTPLIEQKDIPDYPSNLILYLRPYSNPISEEMKDAFKLIGSEKWKQACIVFKNALKANPACHQAQYGLAIALERLECYKLSRKWLVEVIKQDTDNIDVYFGLALLSIKINELGNCMFFCNKVIESFPQSESPPFYYLLSTCHRLLKEINECNKYYQMFLDTNEIKQSIFASFHSQEWDEQVKSLPSWMSSRSDIPFFRRFKSKQLKKLCSNKIKKIEPLHVFFLVKNFSYVIIKGQLRLRDHSLNCTSPKTAWKVHTGQYINYYSHGLFYDNLQYWITADFNNCFVLEVPAEVFSSVSRETRTNKEVVNMHLLQSFPIFKEFGMETLEAIVLESMKIKKCHKGQIVRKQITDLKLEKKTLFGIILSGICDLKREDGIDLTYLSRGDCFGEEFIFESLPGFASIGNLVVKSENLEVGFIPPQDLLRLPDFELQKLEKAIKSNSHIKRSISKAESGFNFHARWQSSHF